MGRRRQKNPLMKRIILISVGVHIVALPVLAHFNAFKSIQKSLQQVQMVVLAPPPDVEPPKPEKQEKKVAAKSVAKKSASSAQHHGRVSITHNAPHVAVAAGNGDDGGDSPTVAQGDGNAGTVPGIAGKPGGGDATPAPNTVKPAPPIEAKPAPPIEVKSTLPKPAPKPIEPTPPPTAVSKAPVFTEAAAIGEQPALDIPDELRSEALDKTFVAECVVSLEGTVKEVKVVQSTGMDALDRRATQAAKKWKFKPATRDGQAIESRVRLHIEFQVN